MTPDTSLVSIMMVNNEIGVVQPINEIGNHTSVILWPIQIGRNRFCWDDPIRGWP